MRLAIVLAAFALAACQTPCPSPAGEPITRQYHCEDGSDLIATFSRAPDVARVSQEGYTTVELPARIIGAGFRYSASGIELRGRSNEVYWTRPGAAETMCSVVAP